MTPRARTFDVAIVSDFRYPGGTSVSVAQEIRAQHAAGYRTVLVPIRSPQLQRKRSFHPAIVACVQSGMAEMAHPDAEVDVTAAIVRHPAVLSVPPVAAPRISASVVVMVANQIHTDDSRGADDPYYDVGAVDRESHAVFGRRPMWAPIGPLVRASLLESGADIDLAPDDWHNIIAVEDWAADRTRFVADVPVIGRHSRPGWKKWPASADEIRAAYPTEGDWLVRLLGGGETATEILGGTPRNWTLYPFGSRSPREFLKEIDFFVYFHHAGIGEAFGRTVIEALASGAPVIVSPDFSPLFGDACLYASPHQVQEIVAGLYADPAAYQERALRGQRAVEERFAFSQHQRRLETLIGPPASQRQAGAPALRARPTHRHRVLFLTANGEGMGHLTRLMSIARRAPEEITPIFATLSPAFRGVREAGYFCEYIPRHSLWRGADWNPFLTARLVEIAERHEIRALVFDGTWPFDGLVAARDRLTCPFVWIRRAMWKPEMGLRNLRQAHAFSLTIEPGEFAEDYDGGLTVQHRSDAQRVAPIVQLDPSELLPAAAAKEELGLDPDRPAAVVLLGSDNMNELASPARIVSDRCLAAGVDVVFADWLISSRQVELPEGVKRVAVYPLSRYFRAFDFAVSAAGYNSFHELVAFAVPTIFIPMEKKLDDQPARTRYAQDSGVALDLNPFDADGFQRCLETMLDRGAREAMARRAMDLSPPNGAQDAMDAIAALVHERPLAGARV